MRRLLMLSVILALLAGCGAERNVTENLYGENEIRDGTSYVSNRNEEIEYNTREWTMSEQNPNFPNTDGNRLNHAADIDKARHVINDTDGYQAGSVWINGDDLWVTAYKKERLSERDRTREAAKLRKVLLKALPRYHITVKIEEDRR